MLISISLNNSTVLVLVKSTKVRANSNSNSKLELDSFEPSANSRPVSALQCTLYLIFFLFSTIILTRTSQSCTLWSKHYMVGPMTLQIYNMLFQKFAKKTFQEVVNKQTSNIKK